MMHSLIYNTLERNRLKTGEGGSSRKKVGEPKIFPLLSNAAKPAFEVKQVAQTAENRPQREVHFSKKQIRENGRFRQGARVAHGAGKYKKVKRAGKWFRRNCFRKVSGPRMKESKIEGEEVLQAWV